MRNQFDKQMYELNTQLIRMGAMCEEIIAGVTKSLFEGNVVLAREKKEYAREIDQLERDIEQLCMKLLLHQQPVAGDLRRVSSAMKMVTDMKRIGDQAGDIAEISIHLADEEYIKKLDHLPQMAKETTVMVINSIDAYVRGDIVLAGEVIKSDDIVDNLFNTVKTELIRLIHDKPENGEQAADLLMIAKYFERIGDHAVNIAEWVIFAITGNTYSEK